MAATLGIPYEPLPTSPLPVGPAESIKSAAGTAALDDLEMAHESWEIESAGAEPHLTAASTAIADLWDPALESLGYPNLRNWKGDLRRHPDWPFEELAPKGVDDANFLRIADQVDSLFIAIGDLIDFVPGLSAA